MVRSLIGARDSYLKRPDRFWGPPNLLFCGNGDSSPVVRRLGRDVEPCSSCAMEKNTPSYSFTAWCMITNNNYFE
jgi:hypothetical protein